MMDNIHISETSKIQAIALAEDFHKMALEYLKSQNEIYIALSGGNTPKLFFNELADFQDHIPWDKIHIFWSDERCVPPDDEDSNYRMTKRYLFDKIDIPSSNIHRILGEAEPELEEKRYSDEISQNIKFKNGWPVFDWIMLGLGEDGHIASLFPGSDVLGETKAISVVAQHPKSGQRRISLTLPVLNHAKRITYLVSGSSKAQIIRDIYSNNEDHMDVPAARVHPIAGIIDWYLDKDAAADLI